MVYFLRFFCSQSCKSVSFCVRAEWIRDQIFTRTQTWIRSLLFLTNLSLLFLKLARRGSHSGELFTSFFAVISRPWILLLFWKLVLALTLDLKTRIYVTKSQRFFILAKSLFINTSVPVKTRLPRWQDRVNSCAFCSNAQFRFTWFLLTTRCLSRSFSLLGIWVSNSWFYCLLRRLLC